MSAETPLRDTSCRDEFDAALTCFMKADEETRASDCADKFVELHRCMVNTARSFKSLPGIGETQKRRGTGAGIGNKSGFRKKEREE